MKPNLISRWKALGPLCLVLFVLLVTMYSPLKGDTQKHSQGFQNTAFQDDKDSEFRWSSVPQEFSVTSIRPIPTSSSHIPHIQHTFEKESSTEKKTRIDRLGAVKSNFTHAWKGYKDHAWLRDEVMPISGGSHDPFGGWAATLVDALGWPPLHFVSNQCELIVI